jgi:hypothetical protein
LCLVGELGREIRLEVIDDGPGVSENHIGSVERTHFDSKSKILMEEAVAAHSQYRLGEKTKELTISPASRE